MELDELDGVARLAADHAMKQPLARRHDEVGIALVVVERTAANPVLAAMFLEFHAPAADQRQQVGGVFNAVKVGFRNAGHGQPPFSGDASRVILSLFARPLINSILLLRKPF